MSGRDVKPANVLSAEDRATLRRDPSECPHCRAAPAQRVACWHGTPRPAPARIVDVRLVLDREDRTRVYVDGRAVLAFSSAAEALYALAANVAQEATAEQLGALRAWDPDAWHLEEAQDLVKRAARSPADVELLAIDAFMRLAPPARARVLRYVAERDEEPRG